MYRRRFLCSAVSAAIFLPSGGFAQSVCPPPKDAFLPIRHEAFNAWVNRFAGRAAARGVTRDTVVAGFKGGGYLPDVVKRDRNQFQTRRTLEDYIALATSDARLAAGRAALGRYAQVFNAMSARYGVDPYIIAAIWGVESRFGARRGRVPVISATATLAFDGRRGGFYESQLIAALRILQSGHVQPSQMLGSWAGAMGHTQFIPTSYQSFAVDFDGDGRRDIWSDDPTDALASTAAYLSRNGWRAGLRWGGETGVTAAKGSIIRPQSGGPRFTVTGNFRALLRYNNSDAYAISVGVLSDRLRGQGPLQAGFPPDQYGLRLGDRVRLQKGLSRAGYDLGDVDGVIGPATRCAIQAFQARKRLPITGRPSAALLRLIP